MLELKASKTCLGCNNDKFLFEFSPKRNYCKSCCQKKKKPTLREILNKNEMLKLPGWHYRRKRA